MFQKLNVIILVVAILLYVAVLLVYLLEEGLSVPFQIALHVAIYLTIYYVVVNALRIIRSFRRRMVQEMTGVVLLVPIVFGVFAFVYAIAGEYNVRFDLTASQKFSLSPQTINILKNLTLDVRILCFYKENQGGREFLKTGLDQYQYYSKRITYEFIDPDKYPQRTKEYGIENYGEVVFISERGREKLKVVNNEQDITNALLRVISTEKNVLYFVSGHGEPSISDMERAGYGLLAKHLEMENYAVRDLSLMRTATIPTDASCLVLASPKTDLFDEEMDLLQRYVLEDGGTLLVLADVEAPVTVRELLAEWGIILGKDMIIDKMSQLFGANYEVAIIGQYEQHPITANFNVASFFPASSSVALTAELPHEFIGQHLAFSGPGSWAEKNLTTLSQEGKATLEDDDTPGPVSVGVVVTKEVTLAEEETNGDSESTSDIQTKTAKIVVFGDSDFVANTHLRLSGNKDLLLNTVAWLCGEETLISIRPKEVDATPLFLRKGQSNMLFVISVVLMPVLFLSLGVLIFIRRRSG